MTKKKTERELENGLRAIGDVTGSKRAERALRDSEERFRELVENVSEAIYEADAGGRLTYVSPVVERVLGYSPPEMVGRSFAGFIHPDDLPTVQQDFRQRLAGIQVPGEYRVLCKSREVRWVRSFSQPISKRDRVVGLRGILIDITDRRQAEEALRESEERYRNLVETARDVIYTVSTDGTILTLNLAFETITGWSRAEWLGKPFAAMIHPDDLPVGAENFRRLLRGEVPPVSEIRMLAKSGEYLTAEFAARPLVADGKVVGSFGIVRDITERRQAEEALRESEDRYRTLVEAAPDVIYALSMDGIVTSLNSAFESITGWSRNEWLGKRFTPIIHPDDLPAVMEDFRLVLRGEVPPVGEYRMLAKSGQYLTVETVPRPLIVDGKVVGTFGIARDITERRRMEEALQNARDELESTVERQMQRGTAYGLTFRELTVLHLVADGRLDREIGAVLGISPLTVQKHVEKIRAKMKASSRTEASVRAVREGLLD